MHMISKCSSQTKKDLGGEYVSFILIHWNILGIFLKLDTLSIHVLVSVSLECCLELILNFAQEFRRTKTNFVLPQVNVWCYWIFPLLFQSMFDVMWQDQHNSAEHSKTCSHASHHLRETTRWWFPYSPDSKIYVQHFALILCIKRQITIKWYIAYVLQKG